MDLVPGGLAPLQFEPFGIALTLLCALVIAALVAFIFLAIWMYRDAQSRGMSGGLWVALLLIASLVFSFLGLLVVLIVYLLVRGSHPYGSMPGGYGYGGYGYPYPPAYPPPMAPPPAPAPPAAAAGGEAQAKCKSCGAPLTPNAGFCSSCGARV